MAQNLEQRMQGNVAPQQAQEVSLFDKVRQMEHQFQLAMPRGVEASQLVRDALTVIRKTPQLTQADHGSVLGALMTCAQLGLRPNVLGQAYILPFNDRRNGMQAQLVIGYQGLIDLSYRSGQIKSIMARTVFENDKFHVSYGLHDDLVHEPNLYEDRGKPVAYYATVKFNNGGYNFVVYSHNDMLAYRDKNAKSKYGPWKDHFESMAWKTCIRQLSKYMPKATELATAIGADETVRVDLSPAAVDYGERPQGDVEGGGDDAPIDVTDTTVEVGQEGR